MAIRIPSKNIYDKENPKVVDNVIKKIEVEEKQRNIVNENGVVVYSKQLDFSNRKQYGGQIQQDLGVKTVYADSKYNKAITGLVGSYKYIDMGNEPDNYVALYGVQPNKVITNFYGEYHHNNPLKVTIEYEKKTYHWITKANLSANGATIADAFDYTPRTEHEEVSTVYGYEGINYDVDILSLSSIYGDEYPLDQSGVHQEELSAHHKLQLNYSEDGRGIMGFLVNKIEGSFGTLYPEDMEVASSHPTPDTWLPHFHGSYLNYHMFEWQYGPDAQQCTFITDLDVVMCTALARGSNIEGEGKAIATRLVLKCKGISITAYGDIATLKDDTVTQTIGDVSSPYVFKYPSNDFLQDGNTYQANDGSVQLATKEFLTQTLEQYKNGKETATVRCSISNYYNEYGGKMIGIDTPSRNKLSKSYDFGNTSTIGGVTATALGDGGISLKGTNTSGGRIFFNLTEKSFGGTDIICWEVNDYITSLTDDTSYLTLSKFGEGLSNVAFGYSKHNTTTWLSVDNGVTVDAIVYPMINEGQHIPYEAPNYSMAFSLYDEVIPMVYNAQGQDVPMSKYPDGTPKVFQVLGVKTYYDGAVWQELSLQEMSQ